MKVDVREIATGTVYTVWPVDARTLLASGEYEAADAVAERVAAGQPAYPLGKKHPLDAQSIREAHEKEAGKLRQNLASAPVVDVPDHPAVPSTDPATPAEVVKKVPRKR